MSEMQDFNPWLEATRAGYSLVAGIVVLALGWFVGQRLTFAWNIRQKRREFQLTASQQFYSAYGEFFAVWKLWNALDHKAGSFEDRKWELFKRAAAAEAIIEGTLVKLASEAALNESQIEMLGQFRQVFQQLRESLRDNQALKWNYSEHRDYISFKCLAVRVAALLGGDWALQNPTGDQASDQLMKITSNKWEEKSGERLAIDDQE
jgi:hypothetical protein